MQLINLSTRWQEVSITSASGILNFKSHVFNLEKIFAALLSMIYKRELKMNVRSS